MAIRWLKDIGVIKRVLAEAETSARLVAIRSLEMMLSDDALKVLKESHANAISFEKFFIEKAIQSITDYKQTGVIPAELQKAFNKEELLKHDLVHQSSLNVDLEQSSNSVDIGDLESTLAPYQSDKDDDLSTEYSIEMSNQPVAETHNRTDQSIEDIGIVEDPSESVEIEQNIECKGDSWGVLEPSDSLIRDSVEIEASDSINQDLLATQSSDSGLDMLSETESFEENTYDDLLPDQNVSTSNTDDLYDDLLPPVNSLEAVSMEDSYDDLLPPLGSTNNSSSGLDDYDDLLPPLSSSSDAQSNLESFDDLLAPMEDAGVGGLDMHDPLDSSQTNFEDLLPPLASPNESTNSYDDHEDLLPLSTMDDYSDLLPPMDQNEVHELDSYDDLLPPLTGNSDYDDLLSPMIPLESTGLGEEEDYDDLLPPLNDARSAALTEDSSTAAIVQNQALLDEEDSYDDLLPPLKKI